MPFHNVHRLKRRQDGKPRNIVARFARYADHEKVRMVAADRLPENKRYSVYQQYPGEVSVRRRNLLPTYKEAIRRKDKASLVNDKLFINGQLVNRRFPPPGPPVVICPNDRRPPPQQLNSSDDKPATS